MLFHHTISSYSLLGFPSGFTCFTTHTHTHVVNAKECLGCVGIKVPAAPSTVCVCVKAIECACFFWSEISICKLLEMHVTFFSPLLRIHTITCIIKSFYASALSKVCLSAASRGISAQQFLFKVINPCLQSESFAKDQMTIRFSLLFFISKRALGFLKSHEHKVTNDSQDRRLKSTANHYLSSKNHYCNLNLLEVLFKLWIWERHRSKVWFLKWFLNFYQDRNVIEVWKKLVFFLFWPHLFFK